VKKDEEKKWEITDEKKFIIRKEEGKLKINVELMLKVDATELLNNLRMEYKEVHSYWRILTDIRFKLLAIVPTLAGLGVALLSQIHEPLEAFAIGLLGFIVTLGITFYDQRNSQLYNAALIRAKNLERDMKFISPWEKGFGGIFYLRPDYRDHPRKFFGIIMWHDRALAMVYASALGAWLFIIINSILKHILWLFNVDMESEIFSLLLSILLAIVIYKKLKSEELDEWS
jgi:hypothetical protein